MTPIAAVINDFQDCVTDKSLLENLYLRMYLARRRESLYADAPFFGLIHQPALAGTPETVAPVSVAVLAEGPPPFHDSYEFDPPFSMTGSVVMRLEPAELPDIEWDY